MKLNLTHRAFLTGAALLAGSWACVAANRPAPSQAPPPTVLAAMQDELGRSMEAMSAAAPPDYFVSYTVSVRPLADVPGSNGVLLSSTADRACWLEVESRVGPDQLD